MTKITTIKRLRRHHEMQEGVKNHLSWCINPNDHPLPKLPDLDHLSGAYLNQLRQSNPWLVKEAQNLIDYVKREREG